MPLALQGRLITTGPPGNSLIMFFIMLCNTYHSVWCHQYLLNEWQCCSVCIFTIVLESMVQVENLENPSVSGLRSQEKSLGYSDMMPQRIFQEKKIK